MKTQVSFTTDPKRKREAEKIANALGMSLSTVLNMCLAQMTYQRGLPFSDKLPKKINSARKRKCYYQINKTETKRNR